jgi:hypothetical protein
MGKKLFFSENNNISRIFIWIMIIGTQFAFAQIEDIKQRIDAYLEAMSDRYEVKRYNLKSRDIGSILETEHSYHDFFQLRSKKKLPNAFGRNQPQKLYINVISYDSKYLLENAMQFWFNNFIDGQQVRPGRLVRGYDNARPMFFVIFDTHVFIMDMDCTAYTENNWKELTKEIKSFFDESKEAVIIELFCDGPLEWRQNPPDLRRR